MATDMEKLRLAKAALLSLQRFQWEQGCAAQAFLEAGDTDMAALLAISMAYRNAPDGRLGIMGENNAVDDPAAVGEALLYAAETTGEQWLREAAKKLLFYLKHRAPKTMDGICYHFNVKNQVWVDSYYMLPPFLAKAGDWAEAMKQVKGFRKYLYHEDVKLHSHIWEDDLQQYGREDFWGVGNGWAVAGLTRMIAMVPPERPEEREWLIQFLRDNLAGILACQREDGLFHDVLDDPATFVDTNVGQMMAYSVYRGVARGYLDKALLLPADKARSAAQGKVDRFGFVQEVCGLPMFDHSYIAPEGQVFYILMETAAKDYYGQ